MAGPSLSLLVLKTDQLAAMCSFYESLGLEFDEEQHGDGPVHYSATFSGLTLEIYPLIKGTPDTTTRLGFRVPDLGSILNRLATTAPSVNAPKQTEWGLRTVVKDPDGRSVELYQGG